MHSPCSFYALIRRPPFQYIILESYSLYSTKQIAQIPALLRASSFPILITNTNYSSILLPPFYHQNEMPIRKTENSISNSIHVQKRQYLSVPPDTLPLISDAMDICDSSSDDDRSSENKQLYDPGLSPLEALPYDLKYEILSYLLIAEHSRVMRASKALFSATEPIVYHGIYLDEKTFPAVDLLRGLFKRPTRCSYISRLEVVVSDEYAVCREPDYLFGGDIQMKMKKLAKSIMMCPDTYQTWQICSRTNNMAAIIVAMICLMPNLTQLLLPHSWTMLDSLMSSFMQDIAQYPIGEPRPLERLTVASLNGISCQCGPFVPPRAEKTEQSPETSQSMDVHLIPDPDGWVGRLSVFYLGHLQSLHLNLENMHDLTWPLEKPPELPFLTTLVLVRTTERTLATILSATKSLKQLVWSLYNRNYLYPGRRGEVNLDIISEALMHIRQCAKRVELQPQWFVKPEQLIPSGSLRGLKEMAQLEELVCPWEFFRDDRDRPSTTTPNLLNMLPRSIRILALTESFSWKTLNMLGRYEPDRAYRIIPFLDTLVSALQDLDAMEFPHFSDLIIPIPQEPLDFSGVWEKVEGFPHPHNLAIHLQHFGHLEYSEKRSCAIRGIYPFSRSSRLPRKIMHYEYKTLDSKDAIIDQKSLLWATGDQFERWK